MGSCLAAPTGIGCKNSSSLGATYNLCLIVQHYLPVQWLHPVQQFHLPAHLPAHLNRLELLEMLD